MIGERYMPPPPSNTRDFAIAAINLEDTLHSIKLHLEKILNATDTEQLTDTQATNILDKFRDSDFDIGLMDDDLVKLFYEKISETKVDKKNPNLLELKRMNDICAISPLKGEEVALVDRVTKVGEILESLGEKKLSKKQAEKILNKFKLEDFEKQKMLPIRDKLLAALPAEEIQQKKYRAHLIALLYADIEDKANVSQQIRVLDSMDGAKFIAIIKDTTRRDAVLKLTADQITKLSNLSPGQINILDNNGVAALGAATDQMIDELKALTLDKFKAIVTDPGRLAAVIELSSYQIKTLGLLDELKLKTLNTEQVKALGSATNEQINALNGLDLKEFSAITAIKRLEAVLKLPVEQIKRLGDLKVDKLQELNPADIMRAAYLSKKALENLNEGKEVKTLKLQFVAVSNDDADADADDADVLPQGFSGTGILVSVNKNLPEHLFFEQFKQFEKIAADGNNQHVTKSSKPHVAKKYMDSEKKAGRNVQYMYFTQVRVHGEPKELGENEKYVIQSSKDGLTSTCQLILPENANIITKKSGMNSLIDQAIASCGGLQNVDIDKFDIDSISDNNPEKLLQIATLLEQKIQESNLSFNDRYEWSVKITRLKNPELGEDLCATKPSENKSSFLKFPGKDREYKTTADQLNFFEQSPPVKEIEKTHAINDIFMMRMATEMMSEKEKIHKKLNIAPPLAAQIRILEIDSKNFKERMTKTAEYQHLDSDNKKKLDELFEKTFLEHGYTKVAKDVKKQLLDEARVTLFLCKDPTELENAKETLDSKLGPLKTKTGLYSSESENTEYYKAYKKMLETTEKALKKPSTLNQPKL